MSGYPPNWPEMSRKCRERAGWECEWCGSTEKLTAAHVNHDIENPDPWLLCLCWLCHVWYDSTQLQHPAKITRRVATYKSNRAKKRLAYQALAGILSEYRRRVEQHQALIAPPSTTEQRLAQLIANTNKYMHHYYRKR